MKKLFTLVVAIFSILISTNASAQNRIELSKGVYLVSYGNSAVIEDDNNQRSVSIQISQEIKNRQTGEKIYNVVCGKWTKRVVKDGLDAAITAGIIAGATTSGSGYIVSAAAKAAKYIYDDVCDYYGEKYK